MQKQKRVDADKNIDVSAYLYDAKVFDDGKPRSFRLEIYQGDDFLSLNGRGYLGKGVLKGEYVHDSLRVYFPTTKEYIHEPLDNLVSSENCGVHLGNYDMMLLFRELPENLLPADDFSLLDMKKKRREYLIKNKFCTWELKVSYDLKDNRWIVKSFELTDKGDIKLTAERRKYNQFAKVKSSKLNFHIPAGAVRINP